MNTFPKKLQSLLMILAFVGFADSAWSKPSKPAHNPNLMTSWGNEESFEAQSSLSGGRYETSKAGDSSISTLEAKLSLAKLIQNNIQAGAELRMVNASGGPKSSSYFEVAAFGVYNFTSILKDTFYAKGGLGLFNTINTKGDNENKFGFFAGGGKRIPLWNQITYSPEARLWKVGDQDITFSIYFLNLSLFF